MKIEAALGRYKNSHQLLFVNLFFLISFSGFAQTKFISNNDKKADSLTCRNVVYNLTCTADSSFCTCYASDMISRMRISRRIYRDGKLAVYEHINPTRDTIYEDFFNEETLLIEKRNVFIWNEYVNGVFMGLDEEYYFEILYLRIEYRYNKNGTLKGQKKTWYNRQKWHRKRYKPIQGFWSF